MSKQKLKKAIELLDEMVCQADEDTPNEYRTKHFRNCMSDCIDFLEKHYKENEDE
tara:strand:+ start:529 stop:693 length:165 start_codon:yes stop_codon:yes gene_type:complete